MSESSKYFYMGNQKLKRANVPVNFTKQQVKEYVRCSTDIVYFVKKYVKIVNVDQGIVPFNLWPFQEEMINTFANNRFSICKLPRQVGKTTVTAATILWYILFHENYSVALLAHKLAQAREILGRIQLAYENLPKWMQQGVVEWNKSSVELENGSKILAAATSSSAIRGGSFNCVAGNSIVTIKVDTTIYDVTIETLFNTFQNANLSKYIYKPEQKDVYVFRKQILQVVSQYSEEACYQSSSTPYRKTPYNTEMYGWERRQRKHSTSNYKRASITTPTISKKRNRHQPQEKTFICGFSNDVGAAGTFTQTTDRFSKSVFKKTLGGAKVSSLRGKGFSSYPPENKHDSHWKDRFERHEKEDFREKQGPSSKHTKNFRTQKEYINVFDGEAKVKRAYIEDQSQSRKNSKDSSCTSRNETLRRITQEDEFSRAWQSALEQRKEIKVLTSVGYKCFYGIKRTDSQKTIKLSYSDGNWLECTPDHLIFEDNMWVEAKNCVIARKTSASIQDVFDIIGVEEVSSFICNGINVHNCIYLDEFAFVPPHFQGDFFASVYPTISSGNTTKVIITSTPKGLNMFYKMWSEAVDGKNSFVPFEVHWSDVPGRDEKWKEETIRNTSERQFREEFETEFIGSSSTLINPGKLLQLPVVAPIHYTDDYAVYEDPTLTENKNNLYVLVADTSRGVGRDYSAFVVYNVTQLPYKVAARYKNNEISPLLFPNIIHQFAKSYNDAYTCIEVNDNGQQVADILYRELEYENVVMTQMKGRQGQVISGGFASRPTPGVRTTAQVKRIGCTNFKTLVESDKLILGDAEILDELYRFVETGDSYAAEEGANDDLAMCCVIFAWMTMQPYFREWTETNVREKIQQDNLKLLDEEFLPFEVNSGDDHHHVSVRELSSRSFDRWLLSEND